MLSARSLRSLAALAVVLAVAFASPSAAGPNLGGCLVYSWSPDLVYSQGTDYCGTSDIEECWDIVAEGPSQATLVIQVLASFFPCTQPRMAGVVFGIAYDSALLTLVDYGHCGDFEIPSNYWPEPYEGTAVAWNEPREGIIEEVYWFAAYASYDEPTHLAFTRHPSQNGPYFADDAIPANLDIIIPQWLGTFGFGGAEGYLPCSEEGGACCLPDGSCVGAEEWYCEYLGGDYIGRCIPCEPDPCALGACCLPGGDCEVMNETFCGDAGGIWEGAPSCEPDPCTPVPAVDSSWGKVKQRFR